MDAKAPLTQIRGVVEACDDREVAKSIYRELMLAASRLSDKHQLNFRRPRRKRPLNK